MNTLVRTLSLCPSLGVLNFCFATGRHIRRVIWTLKRHLPSDEQYVSTPRLPVALVHGFPHNCVLVLHGRLVVAAVKFRSVLGHHYISHVLTWQYMVFDDTYPLRAQKLG